MGIVDATGRIGLFGGSFNPIHFGHLIVAEEARVLLGLHVLHLLPCGTPPHKPARDFAPAEERLAMARLATRGNPHLRVLDLEVRRGGTTYTIDTLRALRSRFGSEIEILFLIGADSVPELPTWREVEAVLEACTVVPLARPGFDEGIWASLDGKIDPEAIRALRTRRLLTPRIEIASSDLRRRIRAGRSIRYRVPEGVRRHIERQGLYGAASGS